MLYNINSGFFNRIKQYKYSSPDKFIFCLILFYSFTPFISGKINSLSQALLGCLFFYLLIKNPFFFRKEKMTRLFFLAVLAQIITWVLITISNPELSSKLPSVDRLGKLFLFIPIAWGLRKTENPLKYVFIASLSGFILGILINSDFLSELGSAINGERIDFGIKNAQHPSMIFGLIFLICFLNVFVFEKLEEKFVFFFIGSFIIKFLRFGFYTDKAILFSSVNQCFCQYSIYI